MKNVIPFRRKHDALTSYQPEPDDLFLQLIEGPKHQIFCFLDDSALCRKYLKRNPWVVAECDRVVLVNQELIDAFQIGKVPMFNFYHWEYEVHTITGTATVAQFRSAKERCEAL